MNNSIEISKLKKKISKYFYENRIFSKKFVSINIDLKKFELPKYNLKRNCLKCDQSPLLEEYKFSIFLKGQCGSISSNYTRHDLTRNQKSFHMP